MTAFALDEEESLVAAALVAFAVSGRGESARELTSAEAEDERRLGCDADSRGAGSRRGCPERGSSLSDSNRRPSRTFSAGRVSVVEEELAVGDDDAVVGALGSVVRALGAVDPRVAGGVVVSAGVDSNELVDAAVDVD